MNQTGVSCLLMGGQACVLYGGAEFSRDTDLAILADDDNLARLRAALDLLEAKRIAVPAFEKQYLDMGLAVHFRCEHPAAQRQRVDVMSRMRGVVPFAELWQRRTTFDVGGEQINLLSLPDLVAAKKTQRDKDWPMITRLLEANYFTYRDEPTAQQIPFWLCELRTPSLLIEVVKRFPGETTQTMNDRPLLHHALREARDALAAALMEEENQQREADQRYWAPLKAELERLRRERK